MPRLKLTEKAISKLRAPDPSGRQTLYWDDSLRGFGVLVSGVSKSKSYVVQRDLASERTRRVTIGPTNVLTLDKARVRAKEVLADFFRNIDPKSHRKGNITLREALDSYLASNKELRERSRSGYRACVEMYLADWLDSPLRDATREMVVKRHQKIAKEIADENPERTGEATANLVMRSLRAIYNHAIDLAPPANPMPASPVNLKKGWFKIKPRTGHVSTEDLPKFYKAVCALTNKVARDYILLLLFCGLRRREASELRWSDVDLSGKEIRLPAARTKSGRPLNLPLTDFVHDLLVARRAVGKTEFVFPAISDSGHIEEPRHPLDLVRDACGVSTSAHDLRRSYITIAESTEMSVLALKALVNHSLGKGITEGYVQMNVERLREPAQKVCDRMKLLCGITTPAGENVARMTKKKSDLKI